MLNWREAHHTWAVYATPVPPFYMALPVLHFAEVVIDEASGPEIVGMVSDGGVIVNVWQSQAGELVDYYRITDGEEYIQNILKRAVSVGESRYRELLPQDPAAARRATRRMPQPVDLQQPIGVTMAQLLDGDDDHDTYAEADEEADTQPRRRSRRRRR